MGSSVDVPQNQAIDSLSLRLTLLFFLFLFAATFCSSGANRRQSAEEWRRLVGTNRPAPQVFVNSKEVRFYFPSEGRGIGFRAELNRPRVPTDGYEVSFALLRLEHNLSEIQKGETGWRRPVLIAGEQWHALATKLLGELTPSLRGHGIYYRGLLGDRFLYRAADGSAKTSPISPPVPGVVIDHRYSTEETLQILGRLLQEHLLKTHPKESLFMLMTHPQLSPQPLLYDRVAKRCVWLSPSALYDSTERGIVQATTARSISALIFEAHGVALIKNPVSSAARLGNLLFQTVRSLVILPWPGPSKKYPPLSQDKGMDLVKWEHWLDKHTYTRLNSGSIQLLIDGERFFPRFEQAIAQATNHINIEVFIFDNDDVAVGIADKLKQRSNQIKVKVILDQLGSLSAGAVPPSTPPAHPFIPPASIVAYLKADSQVEVHQFLNPFCSYDHSKIYLVDGNRAWLGGMNIGREYRFEWHDMMVELQGPVVGALEREYRRAWAHEGPLGDLAYAAAVLTQPKQATPPPDPKHPADLRLLTTKTVWKSFDKAVLGSIRRAKSYIYVEHPYLFNKQVLAGLARARARGVDVRVVVPHVLDSRTGGRAELVSANYLLEHGVRVFFYPGMTHVKAMMADGWACVGSGNFNEFGLHLCQEHNVATSNPAFAAQLKHNLFEEDFRHSYELIEPVPVAWTDFLADVVVEGF